MADRVMGSFGSESGAVFNAGLSTLEKIHNILKKITEISIDGVLTPGEAQHHKFELVNQFFIQCIPLFPRKQDDWKIKMKKRIRDLQTRLIMSPIYDSLTKKIVDYNFAYSPDVAAELDDITIEIQEVLQEEKYFMPSKADPRYAAYG